MMLKLSVIGRARFISPMEKFKASFFVAKSFYPMIQRLTQEQKEKVWFVKHIEHMKTSARNS